MKKLKLFFALFAMLALGVGNAWAETVEFDLTTKTQLTTQTANSVVFTNGGATLTITKSASGTAVNNYMPGGTTNASHTRVYKTNPITFDVGTGNKIQSVTVKVTSSSGAIDKITGGTWSPTVTTSGSSPTITYALSTAAQTASVTPSGTSRIEKVTLTYVSEGGSTPEPEPDPDPTPDPEEPGTPGIDGESSTATFTYKDLQGQGASSTGAEFTGATKDPIFMSGKGYCKSTNSYVQIYANNYLTFTPTNATITRIVLTATSGYIKTWKASEGTIEVSGDKATWTGSSTSVVTLTNTASAQARITQMDVTYTSSSSGTEEPVLSVSPENITWKGIAASAEKSEEITVTLSNIETVTATLSGENSSAFSIDKNSLEASGKIVVSKNITTIGTYAAILTITDADTQTKTVTLSMEVVADPEPTGTFEKFTGTLEEGDYVLVANGTTDALKNNITSNRFDCGTVEVAEDKIVNPDKSVIWHIAANGSYWTMYNESTTKYAGGTTTKNQGALLDDVTDLAKWTITVDDQGVYTFENYGRSQQSSDSGNKFLSKNSQNAFWATYASGQKNPVLYKKSDGKQPAGLVYETNKYRTKLDDSFVTPTLTNPNSLKVTYSSSNNDVAEVANDGAITIKAVGGVVITATFEGDATYRVGSATYTICVTEHAGTETDPYTVADAKRVIDVLGTVSDVYATGIVSQVDTYNSTYKSITYWISADGTSTNHMQVYGGLNKEGEEPFSSKDDIKTGDEVVVKGNLKLHDGTVYEFDANNQLVSLKRDKQQAGLAYEEKEHTANVGEDFTEPTLTNPNSLTVTYSSSNTALATVDATTGEVSILAAGKVTITASSAADATYAAGSASYNITITDPSLAIATLPFYFDGKRADIEGTAGMTQSKIGTDYAAAPYLKFNAEGAWAIVQFDSEPGEFSFLLKQNGESIGTFTVYESENGEDYTPIWSGGDLGGNAKSATIEPTLSATARYVKFEYTTKPTGTNYGLGEISIKKADNRAEAGLAWNPATVSLTVGDAFTAPTFSNPNSGVTGITFTSDNEALATVDNAGAISLVSGKTGTATITATYAGNKTYKPAEVKCTISVNPKTNKVVILAEYNGLWYALQAEEGTGNNSLAALQVEYLNGTLYNVTDAEKATIEWQRVTLSDGVAFKNGENYLTGGEGTGLSLSNAEFEWIYKIEEGQDTYIFEYEDNGNTKARTFLFYKDGYFKNYATTNAAPTQTEYSSWPVVTAPVYVNSKAALTGKFSTGEYEYAEFAPGNLQYNVGSSTWAFAANQYDVIGEPNINVGDPTFTGTIDMFGWSTDDTGNNLGVNPSMATTFYTGNFVDWGKLFPVADNYSTLTHNQWYYLLNERANASSLKQVAYVGTVFGIMLFPDNWTYPDGCKIDPTLNHDDADGAEYDFYSYNYTLAQWTKLEAAGAVFLPAAGRRFGGHGNTYNSNGEDTGSTIQDQHSTNGLACYWTSSKHTDGKRVSSLFNLQVIGENDFKYNTLSLGWYGYGNIGQSVRLAKVTSTLIEIGGGDNSAVIADNAGKTVNVKLDRPFNTSGWGTLCVPFEMSASVIGEAYELGTITKHQTGEGINLNLAKVETIEAGKPYLIKANVLSLDVIKNVTIVNTTGSSYTVTGDGIKITFTGLINGDGQTNGSTEYYVGANDGYLYNAKVDKLGLRALFTITDEAGNPTKVRARVVTREDAATGFENITNGENTTIKVIENGQLVIIRNGEKFNAQGVRL